MKTQTKIPQFQPMSIEQLDGSPSIDSVSRVAMGQKPETLQQSNNNFQAKAGDIRQGNTGAQTMDQEACDVPEPAQLQSGDLTEAYQFIFKGLSMLMESMHSDS